MIKEELTDNRKGLITIRIKTIIRLRTITTIPAGLKDGMITTQTYHPVNKGRIQEMIIVTGSSGNLHRKQNKDKDLSRNSPASLKEGIMAMGSKIIMGIMVSERNVREINTPRSIK
jgi:hypothetical protein